MYKVAAKVWIFVEKEKRNSFFGGEKNSCESLIISY